MKKPSDLNNLCIFSRAGGSSDNTHDKQLKYLINYNYVGGSHVGYAQKKNGMVSEKKNKEKEGAGC